MTLSNPFLPLISSFDLCLSLHPSSLDLLNPDIYLAVQPSTQMSAEPNPQDKDEEKIITAKKHKQRSRSRQNPSSPFITRVVRRLRDGCDEFIERMDDMEHGYRDKNGRKTKKGLERDYEIDRRRAKRKDLRKERKAREGGPPVEALMSGGMADAPLPGGHQDFAQEPPAGAMPPHSQRSHNSMASARNISPMPSEHSTSSIMAQVGAHRNGDRPRQGRQAGGGPEATRGNPLDSEDEERPGSEFGSSSEDEAGTVTRGRANRRDRSADGLPPPPSVETAPPSVIGNEETAAERGASGLRGGGIAGIDDLEDEEIDDGIVADPQGYNEYEDFDDEYTTAAAPPPSLDSLNDASEGEIEETDEQKSEELHKAFPRENEEKEESAQERLRDNLHGESHEMFQNRERRPYSVGARAIIAEEVPGSLSQKKPTERTPRPYANPTVGESTRVCLTEAAGKAGASHQQTDDKARKLNPKQNAWASSTDSDSGQDCPVQEPRTRARFDAARSRGARNHHRARTGVHPNTGADHANPNMKKASGPGMMPGQFPNGYFKDNDDMDELDATFYPQPYQARNDREEVEFRRRVVRDGRTVEQAYARGPATPFPFFHGPYATSTPDDLPHNPIFPGRRFESFGAQLNAPNDHRFNAGRRRPLPGGRYGGQMHHNGPFGGTTFFRTPEKVPGEQESPLRNEAHYSQTNSQSSSAEDAVISSSASETSSESEPEPRRKEKGPAKPSWSSSSDDFESPRRKPMKGKAKAGMGKGKTRARAESPPPRKPSSKAKAKAKANQGKRRSTDNRAPPPKYNDVVKDAPPNHYARLGLTEGASAEEIKKACKKMRVKTHPDQVKRENPNMTEEEIRKATVLSAKVGEAADVLEDPSQKRDYDDMIYAWKRKHGGKLPKEQD
ncbi:MAG: hypothetical protein Q9192_001107 [Flavoplaca navasiana]